MVAAGLVNGSWRRCHFATYLANLFARHLARLTIVELARAYSREVCFEQPSDAGASLVTLGGHLSNPGLLLSGELRAASADATLLAGAIQSGLGALLEHSPPERGERPSLPLRFQRSPLPATWQCARRARPGVTRGR